MEGGGRERRRKGDKGGGDKGGKEKDRKEGSAIMIYTSSHTYVHVRISKKKSCSGMLL